jgi:hypothetical protein
MARPAAGLAKSDDETESTPNPSSPLIWVWGLEAERMQGRKKPVQHAENALISVVTPGGPRPQYQAEKTTAAQTVKRRVVRHEQGESACQTAVQEPQ